MNYTLSGANTGTYNATFMVVSLGTGTFTIPASALINSGQTFISITSINETNTPCSVSNFTSTVIDDFMVSPVPNLNGTNTISINDTCLGNGAIVNVNSSSLANGTYNIQYTLGGANTGTFTASIIVLTSGTGTFTIPASVLTNIGTTSVSINTFAYTSGLCSSVVSTSITGNFNINQIPNITNITSITTESPICNNDSSSITFNANGLSNGSYNITYTLSGANNGTYSTTCVVNNGIGNFDVNANNLVNIGNTQISLVSISNSTTNCLSNFLPGQIKAEIIKGSGPILSGNNNQIFCLGTVATINDLILEPNNVNWYSDLTSTTPLNSSTELINGYYYYAEAVDPVSGCVSNERFEVLVNYERCEFLIPDGFSPNGDGVNDIFNIVNGEDYYPNYYIEIYDRYGSLLHRGKNWDGKYNGNLLSTGVYYLIMYYNNNQKSPSQHRFYLNK